MGTLLAVLPLTKARLPGLQVKPNTPVLMCSVPGYDASGHVEDLAAEQNTQITSIAIGKGSQSVPSLGLHGGGR